MNTASDAAEGFSSLLLSPIITVLAGAEMKAISVYSAAFQESASPALKALVNGDWKEGQEKVIDWSHTDTPTIIRVISFLYNNDYNVEVLKLNIGKPGKEASTWDLSCEMAFRTDKGFTLKKSSSLTSPTTLEKNNAQANDKPRPLTPVNVILGLANFPTARQASGADLLTEDGLKAECDSVQGYLVAHAHIYIFAQMHLMSDLERLVLERMAKVLQFAEKTSQTQEVLHIVNLVYDNTSKPASIEEPMRKLLSHFIVLNMHAIRCTAFSELVKDGGDFAFDVCDKMFKQMLFGSKDTSSQPIRCVNCEPIRCDNCDGESEARFCACCGDSLENY